MWTYEVYTNYMDVYDHTDTKVTSVQNDGTGFDKQDMLTIMMQEAEAEYQANGFNNRVWKILRDAIFEQIEMVDSR